MNEDILNEGELIDFLRPLLELGETLGIPTNIWTERETLTEITFSNDEIRKEHALNLTLKQTSLLLDVYGDAIKCNFSLNDLTILKVVPGLNNSDLHIFKNKLIHSPTVKLDLKLDKALLAKKQFGEVLNCNIFLYLSNKGFERFLTSDLPILEEQLWGIKQSNRVIIQIPSHEIYLIGQYLAIIGGSHSKDWRDIVVTEPCNDERLKSIYSICQDVLKWQSPWLKFLTPIHLQVDDHLFSDDTISKLIRIHLINSIILYTADKTVRRDNGRYIATYASSRQSIDVFLENPEEIINDTYYGSNCLYKIFDWAYDPHWATDRLPFVQVCIVQALYLTSNFDRYKALIYNSDSIYNGLQWHWKAFIEGKIDTYMVQVKDLEEYVYKTVQAVADQVSAILKSLSDTMLAAIGAFLGSFIAALFGDKFNPTIFKLGIAVYAIYVLIFPLSYNMIHQWQYYQALINDFERRRRNFEGQLYPKKVHDIIGTQIEDSQKRFNDWFRWTIYAYLGVMVVRP